MDPRIVLVTLIFQITSSRCRSLDNVNKNFGFTEDVMTPNLAEPFAHQDSSEDYHQDMDRFNEFKKFLKVIPVNGNMEPENDTVPNREVEEEGDFPVAVIMASHLKENVRDNLKNIDINGYLTKVIENAYKLEENNLANNKTVKHSKFLNKAKDLIPEEPKLDHRDKRILVNNATHLDSVKPNKEKEILKILNDATPSPIYLNVHQSTGDDANTELPLTHSDIVISDYQHRNISNVKDPKKLNKTKTDDPKTLPNDALNIDDITKSIHNLDDLDTGSGNLKNHDHSSSESAEIKLPALHRILSCRNGNVTDDKLIHNAYNLNLIFNL